MENFGSYGYQIIEQLSHNYMGGSITYKAQENETQDYVVIKLNIILLSYTFY